MEPNSSKHPLTLTKSIIKAHAGHGKYYEVFWKCLQMANRKRQSAKKWDVPKRVCLKLKDRDPNSKLVYSTEFGKICPSCGKQSAECICKKKKTHTIPKGDGKIRVERSTKGRKGKGVSLISGLPLESPSLKELAKELKQKCGTGGTVRTGMIEIQGDHRDFLVEYLNTLGYKAVKAGG